MFEKILIVYKEGLSKKGFELIEKIKTIVDKKELEVIPYHEFNEKHLKNKELVITIGGDGTFAKAANLIEDSLILGINSDLNLSEGFLTSLQINEVGLLKNIIEGKFDVKQWQRIKVAINKKLVREKALNEVFIGSRYQYQTARYIIKFKDKQEEQRSSGVIVSTGTGSSAWYKSAGGKEFSHEEKKLCFIVREPYFGKRLFKPMILNGEILAGEKLIISSKRNFGCIVAINEAVYDFNNGDVVEIELSDKPLKVVVLTNKG